MLYAQLYNDKIILAVIIAIITALFVDTSLIRISELLIRSPSTSVWKIFVFIIIGITYAAGQFLILGYVRRKSEEIRRTGTLYLNYIDKIVTIIQYVLTAVFALILLQILTASHYDTFILTFAIATSYTLSITLMGLLAQHFFSWFRSNRHLVVLLYGLSSAMIACNSVFTLLLLGIMAPSMPTQVGEQIAGITRFIVTGSVTNFFNSIYVVSSIISFILLWTATAFLLRHYSQRLGRVKYWIIISVPLIYFLTQFPALLLNLFAPMLISNPTFFGIFFTLIFALSNLSGGVLFALAFLTIARNLTHTSVVRNYMIISAYGLILLFLSNQGIILISAGGSYPPFGLVTISFMGLSSYLIMIGIYSSAISVAQDVEFRKSIRNSVQEQSKLLDSIGTAQMEREIERRVIRISRELRENMIEETGVRSSISEEDVRGYLDQVIKEVKGKRDL
jgi:hypothetical protein